MPRKLPWLKNDTATTVRAKNTTLSKSNGNDSVKRQRLDSKRDGLAHPDRSISPQSPTSKENEGIREGYDADDIWMMVEDEFLATAQLYTKHLHHAEYLRLQKEAEEHQLRQPLHATMSSGTHSVQTKRGIRRRSSSDEETVAIDHPTLANLMQSPRKKPELLRRGTIDTPQTPSRRRVMSNIEESGVANEAEEDDETDDDLDVQVRNYLPPQRRVTQGKAEAITTDHGAVADATEVCERPGSTSMAEMLARRRNRAKGKKAVEANTNETTTEIPTFLF